MRFAPVYSQLKSLGFMTIGSRPNCHQLKPSNPPRTNCINSASKSLSCVNSNDTKQFFDHKVLNWNWVFPLPTKIIQSILKRAFLFFAQRDSHDIIDKLSPTLLFCATFATSKENYPSDIFHSLVRLIIIIVWFNWYNVVQSKFNHALTPGSSRDCGENRNFHCTL